MDLVEPALLRRVEAIFAHYATTSDGKHAPLVLVGDVMSIFWELGVSMSERETESLIMTLSEVSSAAVAMNAPGDFTGGASEALERVSAPPSAPPSEPQSSPDEEEEERGSDDDDDLSFGDSTTVASSLPSVISAVDHSKPPAGVDFEGFVKLFLTTLPGDHRTPDTAAAFVALDKDGDGYIGATDLAAGFAQFGMPALPRRDLEAILTEADVDRDGKVSVVDMARAIDTV